MPIKFTFRNSTIKQLIAPFQFQRSKVYYLNNSSPTFKDSFPDSLSTDFITAIESIKYEFIDIAEQQKNTFNRINEVIRYHFPTENQYKLINQQDSKNPLSDFLELLEIENHAEHAFIVPLG